MTASTSWPKGAWLGIGFVCSACAGSVVESDEADDASSRGSGGSASDGGGQTVSTTGARGGSRGLASSSDTASSNATTTGGNAVGGSGPTGAGGDAGADGEGGAAGEGCDADIENDPRNCGACGFECSINGALPLCVDSECTFEQCLPTRYDRNGEPSDGCEYFCAPTNDGVEVCDGIDNDCDGEIDENFDLVSVDHCGACNASCQAEHATMECAEFSRTFSCRIVECEQGWSDVDGMRSNGCEVNCGESCSE